jgi:hypothetical protein
MHYDEFKNLIQTHLRRHPSGATWTQLQRTLHLPYDRPCPEWTRRMETEIGLVRRKSDGRAFVWSLESAKRKQDGCSIT